MKPVTIVVNYSHGIAFETKVTALAKTDTVEDVIVICQDQLHTNIPGCHFIIAEPFVCQKTLMAILGNIRTEYLLLLHDAEQVSIEQDSLVKMIETAESTKAGIIYSDFYDKDRNGKTVHPLNDYQFGSVRNDFDFGSIMLFSMPALRKAFEKYGAISNVRFAGLYELRLKVSIDHSIYHIQEPLYTLAENNQSSDIEKIFTYVDPKNIDVQKEMEIVFSDYLKKINAYLPPSIFKEVSQIPGSFPAEASVIIPVKNRKTTIAGAVKNALSQKTDFSFNVIVVDNHSTDSTTDTLCNLSEEHHSLIHIIPERTDLGIGGCWNEALYSKDCGRYAVQLDSDDLYSSPYTLQKIVQLFRQYNYAMVIGSYTIVNFDLKEIPPGLINHSEWTDNNGHNNALRINGLGAPRAFDTGIMRTIGFLNVSYGEDYAAALRISREYRIGRIYESLYQCRRWPGNTDAALGIVETNRNNAFKDKVRTDEIIARQKINNSTPLQGDLLPNNFLPKVIRKK